MSVERVIEKGNKCLEYREKIPSAPLWHLGKVAILKSRDSFNLLQNTVDYLTCRGKLNKSFTNDEKEFMKDLSYNNKTFRILKTNNRHFLASKYALSLKKNVRSIRKQGYIQNNGALLVEQSNIRLKNTDHRFHLIVNTINNNNRFFSIWKVESIYDFEHFYELYSRKARFDECGRSKDTPISEIHIDPSEGNPIKLILKNKKLELIYIDGTSKTKDFNDIPIEIK